MANVLLVGIATLDIIYKLDHYPLEDAETRAQSLRMRRGGNAANTAVVLSQLGHRCSFLGVIADAPETAVIEQDFTRHGVDYTHCPRMTGRPPTSSIYITGAGRTIVHYRDLPEMAAQHITAMDLNAFDWIHFEGRNVEVLGKMLAHVRQGRPELPVSLELEKPREGIEKLLHIPDLLICSRGYAQQCGHDQAEQFLSWMQKTAPRKTVVVAWGEAGAYGETADGQNYHSAAFPPESGVVDTLGAGDSFNAGLIGDLVDGGELVKALESACKIAGLKCGVEGFDLDALQSKM
jgi:ketohexokinase